MSSYDRRQASARITSLQTSSNHWDQAEGYRLDADRQARRARSDAAFAAEQYRHARERRQHLRWLERHPYLWDDEDIGTPADEERYLRSVLRLADLFLRSSFQATAYARADRQRARYHQDRAERDQPYLAAYSERGRAWLARTGQSDAEIRAAHGLAPREA